MKYFLFGFGGFILIGLIVIFSIIGSYNRMITLRSEAQTQDAQIETQMQRRLDLIPNIVSSTRGALKQEKAIFDNIAKAQAAFTRAPSGSAEKVAAGDQLGTALRGYLVVAQQYPELKSLDLIRDLTTELEGTENRISVARQRYNESARDYNNAISFFPGSMLANFTGFTKLPLFKAVDAATVPPSVNLENDL